MSTGSIADAKITIDARKLGRLQVAAESLTESVYAHVDNDPVVELANKLKACLEDISSDIQERAQA